MDDQALKDYFKYDEADLNANRSGRLSANQQQQRAAHQKNARNSAVRGGVILLAFAAVFPFLIFPQAASAWQKMDIGAVIGFGLAALVWVLVWAGLGISNLSTRLRLPPGAALKKAQGPVNLAAVNKGPARDFLLHVGKTEFIVDEGLAPLIIQGDSYAVYFIESGSGMQTGADGKKILSMERIKPVPPKINPPAPALSQPPIPPAARNACPNCGFANPVGSRFCHQCGKAYPASSLTPGPL